MNRRAAALSGSFAYFWLLFAGGIPRTVPSVCVAFVVAMAVGALIGGGVAAYRSRGRAR